MDPKLFTGTLEMMVLDVVSHSPSYGYEIAQTVMTRSRGVFDIKEGSLYPALHRLDRQKFLASYWVEAPEGRRRKYYKVTAAGQRVLDAKRAEWREFAGGVAQVLGDAHYGTV